MNIAERIQKILDEKEITVYKMCKDLEISQSTFTSWKNKKTIPALDKIMIIAEYLEISLDELTGMKKPEIKEEPKITKKQRELINAYAKAPQNLQESINCILEPYKNKESKSTISKIS